MARYHDIKTAFYNAREISPKGRRTVKTVDFVRELAAVNWHWSLRDANEWIEHNANDWKDVSTEEGEHRTFSLYNPNNGW